MFTLNKYSNQTNDDAFQNRKMNFSLQNSYGKNEFPVYYKKMDSINELNSLGN